MVKILRIIQSNANNLFENHKIFMKKKYEAWSTILVLFTNSYDKTF